jgi:hypothetical protein
MSTKRMTLKMVFLDSCDKFTGKEIEERLVNPILIAFFRSAIFLGIPSSAVPLHESLQE